MADRIHLKKQFARILKRNSLLGAGIWPSGQSGGLARRRSRFDPRQGRPLYIWMYTPSAVSILGMDMCTIQKFLFHASFFLI
jgi:hypothetical protein